MVIGLSFFDMNPRILLISLMLLTAAECAYSQDNEKPYEIDKVEFVFKGSQSFSDEILKGILALKKGDDYDFETFRQDIERLKRFYFDNGYFDVDVDTTLVFDNSSEEVKEKFIISEGQRYRINELKFNGIDSVSSEVFSRIMRPGDRKIYEGGFYSKDTVRQETSRIIEILANNGYAFAEAGPPEILKYVTNVSSLEGKVNIILSFTTGNIYTFGKTKVKFKGETYNITLDDVLREISYKEGQIYRKEEIIKSEVNLSKMSILENPRINFDGIDSANNVINLIINLIVSNKYELTPEVFSYYFRNYLYFGVGLSASDKNFLGGGRVLTSSARGYYNSTKNYRMEWINSLFQPFLFGNRNTSGNWNIGFRYISEEFSATSTLTNLFSISHELPTYTYLNRIVGSWETDFDNISLKNDLVVDTLILPSFSLNALNSTLSLGLIHNTVNNLQFPFQGNFQSYEFEDSGLMSGLLRRLFNTYITSYFKFTNLTSFYFNLSERDFRVPTALATKFYFGSIFEYGDNTFNFNGEQVSAEKVPNDERFVCGGSSSVRGWGARQLGIVKDKNIGGNFLLETSVEHRIRPFLEAENIYFRDLGFATFVDVGNVWSEIQKFRIDELAVAAGGGIRYYTIVGAIRFDIGLKIYDPQPGPLGGSNWLFGSGSNFNDKYSFQFGIGNTF